MRSVEELKGTYKKYVRMGLTASANRTLERLRELGVSEQEITDLRVKGGE